jgi:hypothetical protein
MTVLHEVLIGLFSLSPASLALNDAQQSLQACTIFGDLTVCFKNVMMAGGSISGASDAAIKDGWERSISLCSVEASKKFLDLAQRQATVPSVYLHNHLETHTGH